MEKEYLKTFFSVETGGQMTRRNFMDGNDLMRCEVFGCHESLWAPIRVKVEAWIRAGWWAWEDEEPEWFTDLWKLSVLEEFIPRKKGGDEGKEKKKGSNGDAVILNPEKIRKNSSSLMPGKFNVVHRKSVNAKVALPA
ncbi:hypothetical protein TrLO_g4707 [Triparma laevis f. longispina]|uniref:Uncharacterized protein n=1 Tax=Triparma laevis f. longispina TaxID=1714387 RepID=A0A9W7FB48_9STRA|nr:hypothetical protein TrLO_g4707 [Triparma laevis f. longispina]